VRLEAESIAVGSRIVSRTLLLVAVLVSVETLSGCALLIDAEEARLCRSVLPAINPSIDTFKIIATQRLERRRGVKLVYRAGEIQSDAYVRTLVCSFDAEHPGKADAQHLERVEIDGIPMTPLRLHILKRQWLERMGLAADPAPIANVDAVPEVPRLLAVTLQSLTASLPQMAVYALLATAYALIYGLVGRINLAFGDFAILGGYGALLGLIGAGGSNAVFSGIGLAIVLAAWVAAIHGAAAGHLVFAPLVRHRGQVVLIASTALALCISEYVRLAQGSGMRWTPPLFNTPVALAQSGDYVVAATPMSLAVTLIALLAAAVLMGFMRRSRFGRAWRACADDPLAAALMGLSPRRVLLATFVVASLMAGLGGAISTLYYGGATHVGGLLVGLKALIAAILGGIGSVPGAFVGGLLLGAAEALWSAFFPIEFRDPAIYALLAVVLVLRPGGLHGTPDVELRDR
jgi:branched-chain amino acid transport system permease protein